MAYARTEKQNLCYCLFILFHVLCPHLLCLTSDGIESWSRLRLEEMRRAEADQEKR